MAIAAYSCVFITAYSESYQDSSALSPLGRGLTTGTIQTAADLGELTRSYMASGRPFICSSAKSPFSFFSRFKEEVWTVVRVPRQSEGSQHSPELAIQ